MKHSIPLLAAQLRLRLYGWRLRFYQARTRRALCAGKPAPRWPGRWRVVGAALLAAACLAACDININSTGPQRDFGMTRDTTRRGMPAGYVAPAPEVRK